jgi:hypothetical protein
MEVLRLEDVYDGTMGIVVEYHKPKHNFLSFVKEEVFLYLFQYY